MRLTAVVVVLLLSGCAGTPIDATQPLDRACTVSECFLDRDVRDFEVLDQTTLIVYVGAQRCAFKVEVAGTFCDLSFAPEVFFRSTSPAETQSSRDIFGRPAQGAGLGDLRVCSGDLRIDVDGGPFTENSRTASSPPGSDVTRDRRFGNERTECRLQSVASLTDDQVIELYVAHNKVAPPPPMGTGKIEVGEQKDPAEEGAPARTDGAAPPPSPAPPAGDPTGG
jgi:hypothetical protein